MNFDRIKGFLRDPAERIGRYDIIRQIGTGGMAIVYEASDPDLGRRVAIKVLRLGNIERLRREATAAARLRHPHIVTVHEVGADFIVMDYVAGRTLAEALPEMPRAERLRVLESVARSVDYAHGQGVVHRDLKPANVLMGSDGRAILTDFGLAKIADGDDMTLTGSVMGTPHYMAPEQVRGRPTDGRTDVWSLGVMLYEAVADRRPFEGKTAVEIYDQIVRRNPDALPGALGAVAAKALEKDPGRRYASAGAFADDLARHARGEAVKASRLGQRLRRQAPVAAILALVVTASMAALAERRKALRVAHEEGRAELPPALVKWRQAEDEHTQALQREPDSVAHLLARADVREGRAGYHRLTGRNPAAEYEAAEADLARVLQIEPSSKKAHLERGKVRSDRGVYKRKTGIDPMPDFAAAEEDLTLAGDLEGARTSRGNVRFQRGMWRQDHGIDPQADYRAAEEDLAGATDPHARMVLGRVLARQRRFDEANREYAEATRLLPGDPVAWNWWGGVRVAQGDFATAESCYSRAILLSPEFTDAWANRGEARLKRKDYEGAAADFNQAAALNPALEPVLRPRIRDALDHKP